MNQDEKLLFFRTVQKIVENATFDNVARVLKILLKRSPFYPAKNLSEFFSRVVQTSFFPEKQQSLLCKIYENRVFFWDDKS